MRLVDFFERREEEKETYRSTCINFCFLDCFWNYNNVWLPNIVCIIFHILILWLFLPYNQNVLTFWDYTWTQFKDLNSNDHTFIKFKLNINLNFKDKFFCVFNIVLLNCIFILLYYIRRILVYLIRFLVLVLLLFLFKNK